MKKGYLFILITLSLLATYTSAQECDTLFDFNTWHMKGNPNGDWHILDENNIINESYIFEPTFFVNNQNLINVNIKGTISVETGQDTDFIGFVFGYNEPSETGTDNPYNFFLFDWKAETAFFSGYRATEGFRLSHYNGTILETQLGQFFWGDSDAPPKRNLLDTKYGNNLGWQPHEKYEFELSYTANKILIKINGEVIFNYEGCFAPGKIGFYCMSQTLTHFENFSFNSFIDFYASPQSTCRGEEIFFFPYDPQCSSLPDFVDSLNWNFGDSQTSNEILPKHKYDLAGDYKVQLIVYKQGNCIDTVYENVTIYDFPTVNIGNDTTIDACSSISLDAQNEGAEYLWSTGSFEQTIDLYDIKSDTMVFVNVTKDYCTASDTINIKTNYLPVSELYFPTAFSPNGDGLNDKFQSVGITDDISEFNMQIFNRWGQMVFTSNSVFEGWDSYYNGEPSPTGVYIYKLNYLSGNSCSGFSPFSHNGTFTLIR